MKMVKKGSTVNIKEILQTYRTVDDIMTDEEEIVSRIKEIIWNDLDETDRRILLLYATLGSMRATGKELGCSASTVYIWVKRIRGIIKDKLKN